MWGGEIVIVVGMRVVVEGVGGCDEDYVFKCAWYWWVGEA